MEISLLKEFLGDGGAEEVEDIERNCEHREKRKENFSEYSLLFLCLQIPAKAHLLTC